MGVSSGAVLTVKINFKRWGYEKYMLTPKWTQRPTQSQGIPSTGEDQMLDEMQAVGAVPARAQPRLQC